MPPPPLPMVGKQPRWWWRGSSGSARTTTTLGVALVVALVVSFCFVGSRLTGTTTPLGGGTLAGLDSDSGRTVAGAAAAGAHHHGDQAATDGEMQEELVVYSGRRRRLLSSGLGSHPPRCTTKCGSCNPCYPVHVSVPPGVLVTTEYYPEAWRCKCRNQLYMP